MKAVLWVLAVSVLLLVLSTSLIDELGIGSSSLNFVTVVNATTVNLPVSYLGVKCGCEGNLSLNHEQFDLDPELPYSCRKGWKELKENLVFNPERLCKGSQHELGDVSSHFRSNDDSGLTSNPFHNDLYKTWQTGRPPQKCGRYIIAQTDGSGLGHRHGTVVFAANLAIEYGFTMVLSDSLRYSRSSHGRYLNFRESLGLDKFLFTSELDRTNLEYFVVDGRESFFREYFSTFRHRCNILVSAEIGNHTSCRSAFLRKPKFCFDLWPGAYERARRYLQPSYPALDPSSLSLFDVAERRGALSVAWHVRCGDIVVARGPEYFEGVHALIAASGVDHQHYVFWQGCNATFFFLRQILPSAIIVDVDVDSAFQHMKGADVLVHSGSSFPSSAALAAPNPQLYFQSPPKEARWGGDSKVTYALRAAVNVGADGLLEPAQSFAMDAAAAAAAVATSENGVGESNWTQLYGPHVTKILQALHIRKQRLKVRPSGPQSAAPGTAGIGTAAAAAAALRELWNFLALRVISGALAGAAPEDLDVWTHNAALSRRLLPGWTLRVHYNGSLPHNLCRLREFSNVQMIEMSTSPLPPERWQFLPLFGGGAHALVFLGSPARALTPCDAEAITAWAAGCGAGAGAGVLRLDSCACRRVPGCAWAVGSGGLSAARNALARSMRAGPGRAATEGEEYLLRQLSPGPGPSGGVDKGGGS